MTDKPNGPGTNLQIAPDVYARFSDWCKKRNKIKRATVTRLVERLMGAPERVQTAMLGEVDEGMEPDYAAALETLAAELRKKWEDVHGARRAGKPKGAKTPESDPSARDPEPERDARKRP